MTFTSRSSFHIIRKEITVETQKGAENFDILVYGNVD
jgi:hypothetical protein